MLEDASAVSFADKTLVHVTRQFHPMIGGLEDFVRHLASRQVGRFRSVRVVTLDRLFIAPNEILPERDMLDGIEILRIPFSGSRRYPLAPGVFQALADADLIHVHAVDFFFDALGLAAPFSALPRVATTHGGFFHTRKYAALKAVWFNTLTRLSASGYRGIACCSESDFAAFQKVAPRRVRLIENGADLDKFGDAAAVEPRKSIITIGRFSRNKRLDLLLDAMSVLCKRDPQWQLHIVGGASDWSVSDIKAMIDARGLSKTVDLHIGPTDAEIKVLMGHCSLFASASEYEGFGIALIEALSAGLMPIVHGNAAFRALAVRHPTVKIVNFACAEEAADALAACFDQLQDQPQTLRAQAIASAGQHSWAQTAERYDQLYRDALA